jgi:tetratricopeptide (TPR) repeat protein
MRSTDWRFWSALCAALICLSGPAAAARHNICDDAQDPAASIADCTKNIDSGDFEGADLAAFYSNRAASYHAQGDIDRAIADLNEAIRLDPTLAMAHNNRGAAYNEQGDNVRAIADYNEAIKLDPKLPLSWNNRGNAYNDVGKPDQAIADYNEAIKLDPKFAMAYQNRASAWHDKGDNDRAIADFSTAIKLDPSHARAYFGRGLANALLPDNAYFALWADIAAKRGNVPSPLAQASSGIDMKVWPAPVIKMLMDQMTPAAVFAAAADPDAVKKKGQLCEANFYTGELTLTKGMKDDAAGLFRTAASDCPHAFAEWDAATTELKGLGVTK